MNLMSLDDRMKNPHDVWASVRDLDLKGLDEICREIWKLSSSIIELNTYDQLGGLTSQLIKFEQKTEGKFDFISDSISEYLHGIAKISQGEFDFPMPNFARWWGRGLNYLALVKRSEVEKA